MPYPMMGTTVFLDGGSVSEIYVADYIRSTLNADVSEALKAFVW